MKDVILLQGAEAEDIDNEDGKRAEKKEAVEVNEEEDEDEDVGEMVTYLARLLSALWAWIVFHILSIKKWSLA